MDDGSEGDPGLAGLLCPCLRPASTLVRGLPSGPVACVHGQGSVHATWAAWRNQRADAAAAPVRNQHVPVHSCGPFAGPLTHTPATSTPHFPPLIRGVQQQMHISGEAVDSTVLRGHFGVWTAPEGSCCRRRAGERRECATGRLAQRPRLGQPRSPTSPDPPGRRGSPGPHPACSSHLLLLFLLVLFLLLRPPGPATCSRAARAWPRALPPPALLASGRCVMLPPPAAQPCARARLQLWCCRAVRGSGTALLLRFETAALVHRCAWLPMWLASAHHHRDVG